MARGHVRVIGAVRPFHPGYGLTQRFLGLVVLARRVVDHAQLLRVRATAGLSSPRTSRRMVITSSSSSRVRSNLLLPVVDIAEVLEALCELRVAVAGEPPDDVHVFLEHRERLVVATLEQQDNPEIVERRGDVHGVDIADRTANLEPLRASSSATRSCCCSICTKVAWFS